jgi:tetratricopeptide (TPR) repeat protein
MSLINQMLKDIEKRTRSSAHSDVSLSGLRYTFHSRRGFNIHWIIIAILSCFIIFSLVHDLKKWQFLSGPGVKNLKITLNPKINHKVIPQEKVVTQHVIPTVLTGMTLQIQKNITSLRFSLSQNTLYRVDLNKKENKLFIFLDHSHLIAGLPPVNYTNSAIKKMEIFNLPNNDLKIVVSLVAEAQVSLLKMNESSKFPELQLDLITQESAAHTLPEVPVPVVNNSQINSDPLPIPQIPQNGFLKQPTANMLIQEQYEKAKRLSAMGQYQSAIQILNNLTSQYPNFSLARESLAKLYLQQGDKLTANKILATGIAMQPNYIPFVELQARLLADAGKTEEALTLLQRSAPPIAENPDYYAFIAALYQRQGQSMMSAKLYEELLHLNSNKAVWWLGLGIALESLNKSSQALEAYGRASQTGGLTPELSAFVAGKIQGV